MSDTSYPVFQRYGTAAQRAAFTPSPAAGTQPIYEWYETDTDNLYIYTTAWKGPFAAATSSGRVKQVVNTQTGAVATGTTQIPLDDTIPQNTEGTEFMSLAITPTNASNKLKIDVVFYCSNSGATTEIVALFQDTTADALAASSAFIDLATASIVIMFTYFMVAGTTSATTFKVRAGPNNATTVSFNGQSGARRFGGVASSSITITEIVP